MTIVEGEKKLISILPQKGFGYSQNYGLGFFGYMRFGEDNQYAGIYKKIRTGMRKYAGYGSVNYGIFRYGSDNPKGSVFTTDQKDFVYKVSKTKFYWPYNPRTVEQQANRTRFAILVFNWQSLTLSEKASYNKRARSRRMSGMNLFIKEG